MKSLALFSLAAAVVYAEDVKFPATTSLRVSFPSSENTTLVFEIHQADESFNLGYTLDWAIVGGEERHAGMLALATVYPSAGKASAKPLENLWSANSAVPDLGELGQGDYEFQWEWTMLSTTEDQSIVSYEVGDQLSKGSANFAVGSGNKGQPAFETEVTMQESSRDDSNVPQVLSACVNEVDQGRSCSKMVKKEEKRVDSGNGSKGEQDETRDGEGDNGPGSAGAKSIASPQAAALALLVALGTALLM